MTVQPGRYRHYKGNEYTVLGQTRHSETEEELVIYRQEYGDHSLWVRPRQMFCENVTVNGQELPRFQYLGSVQESPAENIKNLLNDLPLHLPQELVQTLLTAPNLRIERIISQGHTSPPGSWYDQDQHEWVVVLSGEARLHFEAEEASVTMKPGDFINIPAHQRHRVEWTTPDEPTIWLAVYY